MITLLDKDQALFRGRELGIDDYISQMNLFRVLLNYPSIARELNGTIMAIVTGEKHVSDKTRELIVMRVAWLAQSEYEWSQHWLVALYFGMTEIQLAAVRDWRLADCYNAEERAVLAATDELVLQHRISSATRKELKLHFTTDQAMIELVTCVANWHMFALILNGLEVPLDENMLSWPPDGTAPRPESGL
jgi:alkylhydroperoxidase family enzyme